MILKEFSQYLQNNISETGDRNYLACLFDWIKMKKQSPILSNVDKIIHAEIYIAKNKFSDYLLIGKSPTGRKLVDVLYRFTTSFEQQEMARFLHDKKPKDFNF